MTKEEKNISWTNEIRSAYDFVKIFNNHFKTFMSIEQRFRPTHT